MLTNMVQNIFNNQKGKQIPFNVIVVGMLDSTLLTGLIRGF